MTAPDIPGPLRAEALALGLQDDLIGLKWLEHCAWVDAQRNPGLNYGGRPWTRFVQTVVAELGQRKSADELREQRAKRAFAEAQTRKRAEDALYAKQAVTLDQWLDILRSRYHDGFELEPHEQRLLDARPPGPLDQGEHAGSWIVEALSPSGGV